MGVLKIEGDNARFYFTLMINYLIRAGIESGIIIHQKSHVYNFEV